MLPSANMYVTTFENGGCVAMLMQRFLTTMIDIELRDILQTPSCLACPALLNCADGSNDG